MRVVAIATTIILAVGTADADRTVVRCDNQSTADLAVDGMLDDWGKDVVTRIGVASDGQFALRCSWDGKAFALSLDILDDRVVRFASGKGDQDHVKVAVSAGGRPVAVDVYPGNALAKAKITKPARVSVGQSLQPKGFSVELLVPGAALAGLTASTPSLAAVTRSSNSAVSAVISSRASSGLVLHTSDTRPSPNGSRANGPPGRNRCHAVARCGFSVRRCATTAVWP